MKHIYLNLKRFDIPRELGGVNGIAPVPSWGSYIVEKIQEPLKACSEDDVEFILFFPEAHLIPAMEALSEDSPIQVGCQGVHREDTSAGGNFGAFTTCRTANAAKAVGASAALIGHCEERRNMAGILAEAGVKDAAAVNRLLNQEVKRAAEAGLKVVYCVGETEEEQPAWQDVLRQQLETGLEGVDRDGITIAYEPVWAIGPGKTLPDSVCIGRIGAFIKEVTGGMDVVYGGGLKKDTARMLASIPEMDGGLIALTRFAGEIGFYPEEYLEVVRAYMGR